MWVYPSVGRQVFSAVPAWTRGSSPFIPTSLFSYVTGIGNSTCKHPGLQIQQQVTLVFSQNQVSSSTSSGCPELQCRLSPDCFTVIEQEKKIEPATQTYLDFWGMSPGHLQIDQTFCHKPPVQFCFSVTGFNNNMSVEILVLKDKGYLWLKQNLNCPSRPMPQHSKTQWTRSLKLFSQQKKVQSQYVKSSTSPGSLKSFKPETKCCF